jgi:hypothetical protein
MFAEAGKTPEAMQEEERLVPSSDDILGRRKDVVALVEEEEDNEDKDEDDEDEDDEDEDDPELSDHEAEEATDLRGPAARKLLASRRRSRRRASSYSSSYGGSTYSSGRRRVSNARRRYSDTRRRYYDARRRYSGTYTVAASRRRYYTTGTGRTPTAYPSSNPSMAYYSYSGYSQTYGYNSYYDDSQTYSSGYYSSYHAPTAQPNNGAVCFPAAATVRLEDGRVKRMEHLKIGDTVHCGDGIFSDVYAFTHQERHQMERFLAITVSPSPAPALEESLTTLTLSPSHYVRVRGDGASTKSYSYPMKAARDVVVGDTLLVADGTKAGGRLVPAIVRATQAVTAQGLYAPMTEHGDIVVNNVLASSFTEAVCTPATCDALHFTAAPVRFAYGLAKKLGMQHVYQQPWPSNGMLRLAQQHIVSRTFFRALGGKAFVDEEDDM